MEKKLIAGPWWTELEAEIIKDALNNPHSYAYVEKFEKEFANWHGRKFGLMTPNCHQAIHLLLKAIGIKKGDKVIAPDCTWIGTTAGIDYCGATPAFCDIEEDTWCLDPKNVEKNITPETKAIITVDLYGNMPKMEELTEIARKHNLPLIEDSAEALGSKYKGVRAGKFGIGSTFSFHRTKTLSTGEGGMLILDDEEIFERAKFLRDCGRSVAKPYQIDEISCKYMPSNIQAALAHGQFLRINELIGKKREIFSWYRKHLSSIEDICLNQENENVENGAWATSLVFGKSHNMSKEKMIEELTKLELPTRPFFQPLSSQPGYMKKGFNIKEYKIKNPVAYNVSSRGITLPSAFELTEELAKEYCDGIKNILEKSKFVKHETH